MKKLLTLNKIDGLAFHSAAVSALTLSHHFLGQRLVWRTSHTRGRDVRCCGMQARKAGCLPCAEQYRQWDGRGYLRCRTAWRIHVGYGKGSSTGLTALQVQIHRRDTQRHRPNRSVRLTRQQYRKTGIGYAHFAPIEGGITGRKGSEAQQA